MEQLLMLLIFGVPIAVLIIRRGNFEVERARQNAAKEAAERAKAADLLASLSAYRGALSDLKSSPANPDIKQRALSLGRAYSERTREDSTTLFDEVALMNDINAACAAAVSAHSSPTAESRLSSLADLKSRGLVSSIEYDQIRSEILKSI